MSHAAPSTLMITLNADQGISHRTEVVAIHPIATEEMV